MAIGDDAPRTVDRLPDGVRLVHIGPPKTGTTAIQGALHAARDELERQGVHYAGHSRHSASAIEAAIGHRIRHQQASPSSWRWRVLLRDILGSHAARVVLSSESFAHARPDAIRRVVGQLDPDRVHVVLTLRPIGLILPSHWQQAVARGLTTDYEAWLTAILRRGSEGRDHGFWFIHRHDELIARWADAVGPDRVTALVVDPRDHGASLRAFERLLGLREATLRPVEDLVNRSLTRDEAAALLALNRRYEQAGLDMVVYDRVVTLGAARRLKRRRPDPAEPRISTPAWALEEAARIEASVVERIGSMGIRILGDPATLLAPIASPPAEPAANVIDGAPGITPDTAGALGLALLEASGMTSRRDRGRARAFLVRSAVEPAEVARVATSALVAVVVNRVARAAHAPARAVRRGFRRRRGAGAERGPGARGSSAAHRP